MNEFDPDSVIAMIMNAEKIPEEHLMSMLTKFMEILYTEDNVVELSSPITICGDIHGQLYDLFELFEASTGSKQLGDDKFLFMGDYVDRGRFSIETFAYLVALKIKHPDRIFMLRGNHECRQVNQMYGFYNECLNAYGHTGIWTIYNEAFDLLPMAALIEGRVFAVHGGLSPKINVIETISLWDRYEELPSVGPSCDLCWSDPDDSAETWKKNPRGAGWLFGEKQVKQWCHNNGLDFVTRSHQLVMEGFRWFFDEQLVTVWSAPNYMYRSNNKACVLKYHPNDSDPWHVVMFDPCPENKRKIPEDVVVGEYFL